MKSAPSWVEEINTERDAVDRREQGASKASHATQNRPTLTIDKPKSIEANESKPTAQRNDPIWNKAIFGVDVIFRELDQVIEVTPSFACLRHYQRYISDGAE